MHRPQECELGLSVDHRQDTVHRTGYCQDKELLAVATRSHTLITTCHDTQRALYTFKVAENTFVLTHLTQAESGKGTAAGIATLGWSRVFAKNSVLAYQLPGTRIQIRSDGKHYFVKIGDRESLYSIVRSGVSMPEPCPDYSRLESLLESRRRELNFYHPVNAGTHGPANQAKKLYRETQAEIIKLQTSMFNQRASCEICKKSFAG
jgi:hypothetical protein